MNARRGRERLGDHASRLWRQSTAGTNVLRDNKHRAASVMPTREKFKETDATEAQRKKEKFAQRKKESLKRRTVVGHSADDGESGRERALEQHRGERNLQRHSPPLHRPLLHCVRHSVKNVDGERVLQAAPLLQVLVQLFVDALGQMALERLVG